MASGLELKQGRIYGGQDGEWIRDGETLWLPIRGGTFGQATVSQQATGIVLHVTTYSPEGAGGYVRAWASSDPEPNTSIVNPAPHGINSDTAPVSLGSGGGIAVGYRGGNGGRIKLFLDLFGEWVTISPF